MAGAQVVIDLANSPSFEDTAALEFFKTTSRNLLAAEAATGSGTMSRYRLSEPTGRPRLGISAPRSP
jgi:hypothetical protein